MADTSKDFLKRLSQDPPFTYCGIDMFNPILLKEARKEMEMKDLDVFLHVFQVVQFILNLQIYYLLMPSYKHFEDLYQKEVIFVSSELVTVQTLLGLVKN